MIGGGEMKLDSGASMMVIIAKEKEPPRVDEAVSECGTRAIVRRPNGGKRSSIILDSLDVLGFWSMLGFGGRIPLPLKQPRLIPLFHAEQVRKKVSQNSLENKPRQSANIMHEEY